MILGDALCVCPYQKNPTQSVITLRCIIVSAPTSDYDWRKVLARASPLRWESKRHTGLTFYRTICSGMPHKGGL